MEKIIRKKLSYEIVNRDYALAAYAKSGKISDRLQANKRMYACDILSELLEEISKK